MHSLLTSERLNPVFWFWSVQYLKPKIVDTFVMSQKYISKKDIYLPTAWDILSKEKIFETKFMNCQLSNIYRSFMSRFQPFQNKNCIPTEMGKHEKKTSLIFDSTQKLKLEPGFSSLYTENTYSGMTAE